MNPRERFIKTLTFDNPDRIPFDPGENRESTRLRWYKEGLPEGYDPIKFAIEMLGIEPEKTKLPVDFSFDFDLIPKYEEKVLEHRNGHYICQDWKGNICEISDEFDVTYLRGGKDFVTRRWIKCPVENRDHWEQMKARYNIDAPGRFPENFAERSRLAKDRDWILKIAFPGPFWKLRDWCGFEGLCMMMVEQPELVDEMAEFWMNFVSSMLGRILQHVIPDIIYLFEDMAYKAKSMISPAMTRRFCVPSWRLWSKQVRQAGCPIVDMDSDGYIGELIPLWIESGFNVCEPIEVAAHCNINEFRKQFRHKIAYRGGVDKRCIAKGGQVIRDELKRIEPVVKDGGFIPSCDHAIPSDVSWADFLDYSRLLAEMTGWL